MKSNKISVGSICSGIEAASVAFSDLNFKIKWLSEISEFPSELLNIRYPHIRNVGDMCSISNKLTSGELHAPKILCAGTPCQAFSLAGYRSGLEDCRGNLTLEFAQILNENDRIRKRKKLSPTIALWENVEGVLNDKTNAFGNFISLLLGLKKPLIRDSWPKSGILHGPKRNVSWRLLDAKYFGLPQQRRRLYVIAGGKDFYPENVLFDKSYKNFTDYSKTGFKFKKQGHKIEIFRDYSDCLYASYGTKWNGNAAAYNGSLYVLQNMRVRRFTPLECERLMGFPDGYTNIVGASRTNIYKALGNSWAVPVITWLGKRLQGEIYSPSRSKTYYLKDVFPKKHSQKKYVKFFKPEEKFNGSVLPQEHILGDIRDIIDVYADECLYLSPKASAGILRRKNKANIKMNSRLEKYLVKNTL